MELNELYGWFRGESTAREDLLPDILGDIDDYTEVELARLYEQVLPRYILALETKTRAGKVTRPFSEDPLKLTKLLLGYFELESTNPEDIGRLGVISFTAQELWDLNNRNPELIGYIKGIEIEDTHLLFDESDPNEIMLKPEFAEIFSKMEKLEHLGLDKIYPGFYFESLRSAISLYDWMQLASNARFPHITQIFEQISSDIISFKMDTTDITYDHILANRVVDNFLEELLSHERLRNVTTLELLANEKLVLTRDCLREASFFDGLKQLKLSARTCYIVDDVESGVVYYAEEFVYDNDDYLLKESDLVLFPKLEYLECSGTRGRLLREVPWFYIGSKEVYVLNVTGIEEDFYDDCVEYLENGKRVHINLFNDVSRTNVESYFIDNQRYNFFINHDFYGSDYDLPGEKIGNGILEIQHPEAYEALLSSCLLYRIKEKGLRLKFRDIDDLTKKMYLDVIKQISFFGIKIDCINLYDGDIVNRFNNLTRCFRYCLDSDSKIELEVIATDIERGVDLSALNETPAQFVLYYSHSVDDPGYYKDGVCLENCDFRINVSEELRKDPTLSLDKMIENTIKSLGKIKYYPYPEIEISGIDVTFDGYESQEIKVVENGDLEEPASLPEVIAEVVEKAGEEYLIHYTSLSLEGFEIKGIGQKFESIKWVELECCDFELEDLEEFLQAFPNLVSISVNECSFSDAEVKEYLKTK